MSRAKVSIAIDPTAPRHGDRLTVTVTGSEGRGVFSVLCHQDERLVYAGGGNEDNPTVTLSSLSWTEGGASCVVMAREQRGGKVVTAATLDFTVEE